MFGLQRSTWVEDIWEVNTLSSLLTYWNMCVCGWGWQHVCHYCASEGETLWSLFHQVSVNSCCECNEVWRFVSEAKVFFFTSSLCVGDCNEAWGLFVKGSGEEKHMSKSIFFLLPFISCKIRNRKLYMHISNNLLWIYHKAVCCSC